MSNKNIWYLPGPFHQYQEDVKALAKDHGLRIIDASATESRADAADEVPDVTVKEAPTVLLIDGGSSSINIDAFRAELESVGLIVESFADQALVRPEGDLGPIADRLFQVFEAVSAGVESLIRERDGEVEKVKALQLQVDDLLQQADKAGREDGDAQCASNKAVWEVLQQIVNRLFRLMKRILHAPMYQR